MNDRGVSVTVNYSLGLAVTALLMSGLLFSTGGMLDDRREQAIRAELDVVGQRLADGLMTADRLAQNGADEVTVRVGMPDRVAGSEYRIEVTASASASSIELESIDPATSLTVSFANRTGVRQASILGGDIEVVLRSDGDLEVQRT